MQPLKKQVLNAVSNLPEGVDFDDIMYQIYVLHKVNKAKDDIKQGRTVKQEDLKREIDQW